MKLRSVFAVAMLALTIPLTSISSTSAATPDSPVHFRTSAIDSLTDIQKDVNDCRIALAKGGMFKLLANITTIEIHVGMLQALVPQPAYAKPFNTKLKALDNSVTKFVKESSSSASVSKSIANLNALEKAAQSLMATVKSIK